jgi:hypothetical protein
VAHAVALNEYRSIMQTLASDFERDLVGLKRYLSGNGIEALYQRSAQGALARVVYRHTTPQQTLQATTRPTPAVMLGRSTQDTIERLLGIGAAVMPACPQHLPLQFQPRFLRS